MFLGAWSDVSSEADDVSLPVGCSSLFSRVESEPPASVTTKNLPRYRQDVWLLMDVETRFHSAVYNSRLHKNTF